MSALLLVLPASTLIPKAQWDLHVWQRLRAANRVSPDIELDQHYRQLVRFLPPQGVVGFQVVGAPDERREEFRLQYALAPRKILRSTLTEFVIECGPAASAGSVGRNPQFILVAALTDELRLFRRIDP